MLILHMYIKGFYYTNIEMTWGMIENRGWAFFNSRRIHAQNVRVDQPFVKQFNYFIFIHKISNTQKNIHIGMYNCT